MQYIIGSYWFMLRFCSQRMCMVAEPAKADADVATDTKVAHRPHPHSAASISDGRARSQGATDVNTYQPQVRCI